MGVLGGVQGPIIEGGAGLFDGGGGTIGPGGGGCVKDGREGGDGGHGEVGEEEGGGGGGGGDAMLAFATVMKMKQIGTNRSWSNLCHIITDEFSSKCILM